MLYDVSSSYYEERSGSLARFGHNRDATRGLPTIVYGVLTNAAGCPVAVDVYPGNTGDPSTVADQLEKLPARFGLERVVLVGDRGMLTQPQIETLKVHPLIRDDRGKASLHRPGCSSFLGLALALQPE